MNIHFLRPRRLRLSEPIPGKEFVTFMLIGCSMLDALSATIGICRTNPKLKGRYSYISLSAEDLKLLKKQLVQLTPHKHDDMATAEQVTVYISGLLNIYLRDFNAGIAEFPPPYIGYIHRTSPHGKKREPCQGKLVIVVPPRPDLMVCRSYAGDD